MPFSPQTLEEKPYNLCVTCAHIGNRCDGPNFLAMEMPRLCEWCRLRKDYLHRQDAKWTNAYISEQAGVSKVSIDRFLSGNVDDIKISTIARIIKVLVNGTWGQYPCAMSTTEKEQVYVPDPVLAANAEHAAAECRRLQAELDRSAAEHKEALAAVRADDQRKIKFLTEQIKFKEEQLTGKDKLLAERYGFIKTRERAIACLSVFLGFAILLIIAALIVDRINPYYGFFWRTM